MFLRGLNDLLRTGWPPGLLQDDCYKLAHWFSTRPDARRIVRQVAAEHELLRTNTSPLREHGQDTRSNRPSPTFRDVAGEGMAGAVRGTAEGCSEGAQ